MLKGFDVISGGVQPELAMDVAKLLGVNVIKTELKKFANGERYARFEQDVCNRDIAIIQSCAETEQYSINDAFMEVLILIDAAKRAGANRISVILPFFPYARQDRKARPYEPVTAALILSILWEVGVKHVFTLDLHSAQIQAVFPGSFENISMRDPIVSEVKKLMEKKTDFVVVAPDAGSVKNSSKIADKLGVQMLFMPKFRDEKKPSEISRPEINQDLRGKNCLVFDDMVDTGGTIISASEMLKNAGAKTITVCATHGILSNGADQKIRVSAIDRLIVTDSIPQKAHKKNLGKKLKVVKAAPLIARTVKKYLR